MKTTIKKETKTVAKKVALKKVVKSKATTVKVAGVVPKKVASKKIAGPKIKKDLVVASNYNSFWMNDGQILNTLAALEGALKKMENDVYKYHTNLGRHDFANWVEDVLLDTECATALRKAKTAKSAHTVVVKFLAQYK
jgi:dienelactone hydrolase